MKLSCLRNSASGHGSFLAERYDPVYEYPRNPRHGLEQAIHSFADYRPERSSNFQKQIADFYAICAMHHDWMNNLVWKEKGIWDAPLKDEFKKALIYAYQTILPVMKEDMLKKLRFSIWAELFHVADAIRNANSPKVTNWEKYTDEKDKIEYTKPTGEYYKKHPTHEAIEASTRLVEDEASKQKQISKEERRKLYIQAATRNLSRYIRDESVIKRITDYAFVKGSHWEDVADQLGPIESVAVHAFEELPWRGGFGGPAWAKICHYAANLATATSPRQMERAIDDVMDLQHNTGFVFNKIPGYDTNMMDNILDYKFRNHPRNLARYASTDVGDMLNYFYRPVDRNQTPIKIRSRQEKKDALLKHFFQAIEKAGR